MKQYAILEAMDLSFLTEKLSWRDGGKLFGSGSFLGIDIGASSIKVVQLKKEKERAVLETYGELALSKYANAEAGKPVKMLETKLVEALKDLIRESQISAKRAYVSIPLRNSFLTTFELPELSESELKSSVPYEARKYIPIPLSEVVLDWWVLPPRSEDIAQASIGSVKKKFISVLLAAVPREVIARHDLIIKESGLEIEAYEIETFALGRSILRHDLGTLMVMDIGASSTKMAIVDAGAARLAHSIDKGSSEFTFALSQAMNINFERAEILKRENGILHKPESEGVASIIEPLAEYIANEGERFLLSWKRHGGKEISRVVLGGGGALLKGIEDFFVKKFGVEVNVANPFSRVVYPAFLEPTLKEIGPSFINAVGAALKGF